MSIVLFLSGCAISVGFVMKIGLTGFMDGGDMVGGESGESTSSDICRSGLNGFRKIKKIGFGTYGDIFMAIHRTTNKLLALKKFRFNEEHHVGVPRSAVREIRLLRELTGHVNIVDCYGLMVSTGNESNKDKGSLYMVLGFVDHDLVGLLEMHRRRLVLPEIKSIVAQTLNAIDYCHLHGIVHRDLKCANILIDRAGVVKLADFGLAREFCRDPLFDTKSGDDQENAFRMTNKVITIWYRPPELLLGATEYSWQVDMWSMGCILGELLLQKPLFSADEELRVLHMIMDELGPPQDSGLEYMRHLPLWKAFSRDMPPPSTGAGGLCKLESTVLHSCSRNSWDLIAKMLSFDPKTRIGAAAALDHPFFTESPVACAPIDIRLPMAGEFCHGLSMKEKRERERAAETATESNKRQKAI